jgi:hypothetical protein
VGTLFKTSFRQRERDLFEEFRERERESACKDVYVYTYKERKNKREILGRSRRFVSESHIVLVR